MASILMMKQAASSSFSCNSDIAKTSWILVCMWLHMCLENGPAQGSNVRQPDRIRHQQLVAILSVPSHVWTSKRTDD